MKGKFMSDLIKRISVILDNLMANESQFTILDVSNSVKNDGGQFVKHTEVRDTVKPILDIIMKHNSVYEKHQIEVNTPKGKNVADLYTPYHIPSDEYKNVSQVASKPVSAPAVPDVAKRAKSYKLVKPRTDGSITVPKFLLEDAGFIGGDGVAVIDHPNSISVVHGVERTLSDDGDFRISKTALINSNISGTVLYICAFSDKVVIASK